jgi:Zn-dependent metalloprotease
MTHGVTAATDGLDYWGDAGGLNEASSDVMGTMVEFFADNANDPGDYYIGEKVTKNGTYIRRMGQAVCRWGICELLQQHGQEP